MSSRIAGALLLLCLTAPATAAAHGLTGSADPNRPVAEYLWLGVLHMIGGWDHLLFIAGVVLLAGSVRSAAKLISVFVAGHSLTLLLATIAGWKLNATIVDVVIALSLVYIGAQGIRGRPESLRIFGSVVFAFGLVHGLGVSTRLQALGLPEDGVAVRVILFNLGVEIGQLTALAVIVGVGTLIARRLRDRSEARRYAFGGLTLAGLAAAAILSFPSEATQTKAKPVTTAKGKPSACTQEDSQPPQFIGGGHPDKMFFDPGETAPNEDLVHVVGDGLIIVRYSPDMDKAGIDQLRAIVEDPASNNLVIGAPDPEQTEPVTAQAAYRTLTCTSLDVAGLKSFRDDWLAYVRQQQQGG